MRFWYVISQVQLISQNISQICPNSISNTAMLAQTKLKFATVLDFDAHVCHNILSTGA